MVTAVKFRALVALALAAAISGTAYSQDARDLRVMARLEFSVTGTAAADLPEEVELDETLWRSSLEAAISRSPRVREVLRIDNLTSGLARAAFEGTQFVVDATVSIDLTAEEARADYRIIDVLSQKAFVEDAIEGPAPYGNELSETFWIPLVGAFDPLHPTTRQTSIRIQASPGTKVYGFGKKPLTVPEGGELRQDVFVPATYEWRAERWGTEGSSGVFFAAENDALLEIGETPLRPWVLEIGMVMAQFPDFWASYYLLQDHVFVRLGFEQYGFGFYMPEPDSNSIYDQAIISLPLIMPGVSAGFQFGKPGSFFRPYAAATAMLRFNTDLLMPDPIGPLAMYGCAGWDWRVNARYGIFAELGATLYPWSIGYLMAASKGYSEGGAFNFIYTGDWFLEVPTFRLGMRRRL